MGVGRVFGHTISFKLGVTRQVRKRHCLQNQSARNAGGGAVHRGPSAVCYRGLNLVVANSPRAYARGYYCAAASRLVESFNA